MPYPGKYLRTLRTKVDEGIACCAETVVVVMPIVNSLSCFRFEGDRCLTDSCRTFSEHGWFGDARNHVIFVAVRVWFGCFLIEIGFVEVVLQLLPVWQVRGLLRGAEILGGGLWFRCCEIVKRLPRW
jgi:hypothetical protein